MENSNNQVKVLIWPSMKNRDRRSIDIDGHVEVLVLGMCYGFFPTLTGTFYTSQIKEGCKGILLKRSFGDVARWYEGRVKRSRKRASYLDDPTKFERLPVISVYTLETSDESVKELVKFLESKIANPPLYSYYSDVPDSRNCQTISKEALVFAGIFGQDLDDAHDVSPDSLSDLLSQKSKSEQLQLTPASWTKIKKEGYNI